MEENSDSVFDLLTNLCGKFVKDPLQIQVTRSKLYEILLGKRLPPCNQGFKDLEGNTDPYLNLLAWQFQLRNTYNLKEHAVKLLACTNRVKQDYESDTRSFDSILHFLMILRNVPSKDEKVLDLSSLPELPTYDFGELFKLPEILLKEYEKDTFKSKAIEDCEVKSEISDVNFTVELLNTDINRCDVQSDNVWELAATTEYCNRHNWENHGCPEPEKEPLFLSELGDLSSLWVENLPSLYTGMFKEDNVFKSKMVSRKEFINDLKYLLVGLASESFSFNAEGEFYSIPGIIAEGITPATLEHYCKDFIHCGTSCKALSEMCLEAESNKYLGYIYKEFCESVRRYLQFYKIAIFSIPESTNYLQFAKKVYELQLQILTLASICKVGPASVSNNMPHGVALLNYLYNEVITLMDHELITVLYSMLHSCCQIYFGHFLKQWILDGVIDDPYGEFFVKNDPKFAASRGRTYWTKSFMLVEEFVPVFLFDLKMDLLYCGQAMNLLKLCDYSNKLLGKKESIITCCVTSDQLKNMRQVVSNYYLDVKLECKPSFEWENVLIRYQSDPEFLRLVAKKRAATLKRLELQRQKMFEEESQRKSDEINMFKEQYMSAIEQKELKIAREIKGEIQQIEDQYITELKRQKIIEEEANSMIDYYSRLMETADNKKSQIEKSFKRLKNFNLDQIAAIKELEQAKASGYLIEQSSSCDSFHTATEESAKIEENISEEMHSSSSMDLINANLVENLEQVSDDNANVEEVPDTIQQARENFAMARKIKEKVMNQELGIKYTPVIPQKTTEEPKIINLTDAQKNKLKVLSSEFNMPAIKPELIKVHGSLSANRNRVMGVSDCFDYKGLDNEHFITRNIKIAEESRSKTETIKKSQSLNLKLDLNKAANEISKPTPMSVDSTPLSDIPQSFLITPSTSIMSFDTNPVDSTVANTAESQLTNVNVFPFLKQDGNVSVFSKRVAKQEALNISKNCLRKLLHESIQVPLITQTKLVNEELLKCFVTKLNYLKHLNYLRYYFFLQDGEFARNITSNLFVKLYDANFPVELINCCTLQNLVFEALDTSSKYHENPTSCLSFKINNLPKCFDLGNPDVLDCLSLSYKVDWPLNILLPSGTIAKYDEVFKFLLKLNRMSWVLKTIFLELKFLAKETGKKEIYLMASPQYRKLHQCRHIMTHFIQTLQNYIVGEILQSNWEIFEKNLQSVTNLDELYTTHTNYIKNILFMCLLNQKTTIIRNVIHKIFVVILKFFDYLRSRNWKCIDGAYVHPNFSKLESIFKNFQELVVYFFKVCQKVAKSGYHSHLFQLLDLLDINGHISKMIMEAA